MRTHATIVPAPLSARQQRSLRALAGAMVPASDEFSVPGADDERIFADMRDESPGLALLLVNVVVRCYYRDDRVMRSLNMELRPPFPKGFELEQGDWSLLDPVRARGRAYREVP